MRQRCLCLVTFATLTVLFFSCKKQQEQEAIIGEWDWVKQFGPTPASDITPQSTGINELLSLRANHQYSVIRNGSEIDKGTYRNRIGKNDAGRKVSFLVFSNERQTDSIEYYGLEADGMLRFSTDYTGAIGGGSRYYSRH